jgi:hypothetical protein
MSERETNRNALIPYAASYPAQVRAAGRQLAIASLLTQDLERDRLTNVLKLISRDDAVAFLTITQALDGDVIERFVDRWDWEWLSQNEALPWSIELI